MLRRFTSLPRVLTKVTFPHQTTRAMASSFSGKKDFLCIIPDKPDALERRLKIRPLHFEGIKPLVANGQMLVGGATVNHHTPPGETLAFNGSMVIYTVESIEEVWAIIKADPYVVNDVWDLERIQIIPCVCAVRGDASK